MPDTVNAKGKIKIRRSAFGAFYLKADLDKLTPEERKVALLDLEKVNKESPARINTGWGL